MLTDEEIKEREERQVELQEKATKENETLNENQAKLKKEIEEGKHNIRTPEEIRKILEKRNAILDEIQTVARAYKVNNWGEIIDIGERHKVFPKGLVASQVKTIVVNHPEKYDALLKAFKADQEITDEDLPKEAEEFVSN